MKILWILAALFTLLLPYETFAQSVWVLNDDSKQQLVLDEFSLPTRVLNDPVKSVKHLSTIPLPELTSNADPVFGGVEVDRFNKKIWATDGNKFTSVDLDTREVVDEFDLGDIGGDWPFTYESDLTGIAIMYGRNDRPKYMWCMSWNEYAYINMRTDPWEWSTEAWQVPNGGFPLEDISFTVIDVFSGDRLGLHPVLVGAEQTGAIWVWNPREPSWEPLVRDGVGLYLNSVTHDTSHPTSHIFEGGVNHDLWGDTVSVGTIGQDLYIRVDRRNTHFEMPEGRCFKSIAYSATVSRIDSKLNPTPLIDRPGLQVYYGMQKSQPLARVEPGQTNVIKFRLDNDHLVQGMLPTLVWRVNDFWTADSYVNLIPSHMHSVPGWRNPRTGKYEFNLSLPFPDSPLPVDAQTYLYAQVVFETGAAASYGLDRTIFSDVYRIPFSNTQ